MSGEKRVQLTVRQEENGLRVDVFLSGRLHDYTRSYIRKVIDEGGVVLRGRTAKASQKVAVGEGVEVVIAPLKELEATAQNIALSVVYEDDDIIVVNKPQGLVVHPAPGNQDNTLVNALLHHCEGSLSGIGGAIRPGIVHRIDKDTSGLLVAAKNDRAHLALSAQFKEHSITRCYYAVLFGAVGQNRTIIDAPIGRSTKDRKKMEVTAKNSRDAHTTVDVIGRKENYTLVSAALRTGRTHQIRVHCAYMGHPVVGDKVYGPKKQPAGVDGQLLHAYKLGIIHPKTGEYREFETPMPQRMENFWQGIEE